MNDKQKRTDGTITSANMTTPVNAKTFNNSSNNLNMKEANTNKVPNERK